MRNHEVTKVQQLLKYDGSLREPGWSRQMYQIYDRSKIKAPAFKIKEWDYYAVVSNEIAVAFTISDDGYIGLESVSLIDLKRAWEHTETVLKPFPMGKLGMPSSSKEGDVSYKDRRLQMEFQVRPGRRRIKCSFKHFCDKKDLYCDIILEQPPMDTMVIATPWKENKKAFYYNQKINCMRAKGIVRFGGKEYQFSPETDFGTLDWGRGVWTYSNTWYWSSGNGIVDGRPFGFNLGYGFGDTSAASENIIFYEGKGHKLADVQFHIPRDSYLRKWKITSSDGRFEMEFSPIIDRAANLSAVIVESDQHQVFGRMSGRAVLDDKRVLEIRDLVCFAEKVHNRY